jgi:iron-sulfur cluster assembly protein
MPAARRAFRVGIKKGGCAGMEYTVDLVREQSAADDSVDVGGAKVFVSPQATLFLLGT